MQGYDSVDVDIVGVNTESPNHSLVPFAGIKDSEIGVEGGYGGLEVILISQTTAVFDRWIAARLTVLDSSVHS